MRTDKFNSVQRILTFNDESFNKRKNNRPLVEGFAC